MPASPTAWRSIPPSSSSGPRSTSVGTTWPIGRGWGARGWAGRVAIHAAWDPSGAPPRGLAFSRWGSAAVSGHEDPGYNQGASSVIDESTERFRVLVGVMERTVDDRELIAYFNEAETILADEVVFIPLYQTPDIGGVWADEIGGGQHNPTQAADTSNLAL